MPLSTAPTRLVKWLAYASGVSLRKAHGAEVSRILMFHGVGDDAFPAGVFERLLGWLRRSFEVLPLAELVERMRRGDPPSGREIALTFDDGLRNNATVAAPLLRRYDLPATFFLCPGLIEDEAWIWNVEARERLRAVSARAFDELCERWEIPTSGDEAGAEDVERVVHWMKALPLAERIEAEADIRDATSGWVPSEAQRLANDMMSWDDVAALDPELIAIGSHTVHHPTLTTLDDADLHFEVVESRTMLEAQSGRPVSYFCYPSGIEDDRVRDAVAATYEAAVTVEPGSIDAAFDLFRIPRIGAVPSAARLAWRLNRP